ncbi:hypothetical protein sscle_15g106650 [Sclerotinia sclerotiorum 1980 UF-70]|uniref:FAD/NAD(P)-binding domain-containing protein n=1 Tax=Sclerotinia sclerotiorum (strain ATCC 18683 / 1980 / Ss-1) TaxID=665079 RepID=A0A1D9QLT5_SCLS1|nr:hypothetical protein sscle_15g106650 [Sclerotinia sclerotiorum 1980 UF-70]
MGSVERSGNCDYDVVIIGAGLSGINTAYRLQAEFPDLTYTILENRGAIGGTWDLFRYPGIRSDSNLYTFGLSWYPWTSPTLIADGESIRTYFQEAAEKFGIDKNIKFHHNVTAADWSTEQQQWSVSVEAGGSKSTIKGRWIVWGTGYYNYNEPLKTEIPGLDNFKGQNVHPQFWPEDLDYTDKKIVVIGSGATAITLIPNLAEKAAKVTMLQRSPTWIIGVPKTSSGGDVLRKFLPDSVADQLIRWRFLVLPLLFFHFCRFFPDFARSILHKGIKKQIPSTIPIDPHFSPKYNPWEQRICACPDGDFFKCLHSGKADVVTDTIKTVTSSGIELDSGKTLDADIIVTATGLKMQMAGGAKVSIDGVPYDYPKKYMWRGVMLQDMPNAITVIGYVNASWTLGAENTASVLVRLMKHMRERNLITAVPRLPSEKMQSGPLFNLSSTYMQMGKAILPMTGDRGMWKLRQNYLVDYWVAEYGSVTDDLEFVSAGGAAFNKDQ